MIDPDVGVVTAGVVIGDVPTPATSTLRVCAATDTVPTAGAGLVPEGVVVPVDVVGGLLPLEGFVVGVVLEAGGVLEGGVVVEVGDVLDVVVVFEVDGVPEVDGLL